MERLTDINLNALGNPRYTKCITAECDYDCGSCVFQHEADRKLKEYEDLEEQGLLLRLPCKVGDKFWEINRGTNPPSCYDRYAHSLGHCVYVLERLGKICFLTKAEAEEALERMVKENE